MLFGIYGFREYKRKECRASFTCLTDTFARARSKAVRHLGSTESRGDICVLRLDVKPFAGLLVYSTNGVLLQ
jgi:hypothetical protein